MSGKMTTGDELPGYTIILRITRQFRGDFTGDLLTAAIFICTALRDKAVQDIAARKRPSSLQE